MEATMIILAGGKNSRMKKEKAFLTVTDGPLIEKTVATGKEFCQEIIVVTNRPEEYQYLDVTITSDLIPGQGPLSGIHAGLIKATFPFSLVVACDMPFISMELFRRMMEVKDGYDVVVPKMNDGLQPLHALYSKNCVAAIEAALRRNVRKVVDVYPDLMLKIIDQEQLCSWGIDSRVFFNVNTPDDLVAARLAARENN